MGSRVAVLASGEGTNLQALLDDPVVGPWIALVVSDREGSGALRRAKAAGVDSILLPGAAHANRGAYDATLAEVLAGRAIDVIALAGFMRILTPAFVRRFDGRMLNVHPALLPAFPGATAVADALGHGVKVTGVTVHLVSEQVDGGPIVLQEALAVREDDDWDSLEARVHDVEHRLFPAAVRALAEGRVHVHDRRVTVEGIS